MLYAEDEYVKVFNNADKDKDGYITYLDLRKLIKDADRTFPEGVIQSAFNEAKTRIPPKDKMDLQEFMDAMGRLAAYVSFSGMYRNGPGPILFNKLTVGLSYWIRTPRFKRWLYEQFFHETDRNKTGFITFEEFMVTAHKWDLSYLERTIRLEFKKHNTRGDGNMDLNEFMIAMGFGPIDGFEKKVPKPAPPPVKKAPPKVKTPKFQLGASLLRQIFQSMDQDGDGVLNKEELKGVFQQMGQEMEDEEIEAMIKANDKEGDGSLTFDEFINSVMPTVTEVKE